MFFELTEAMMQSFERVSMGGQNKGFGGHPAQVRYHPKMFAEWIGLLLFRHDGDRWANAWKDVVGGNQDTFGCTIKHGLLWRVATACKDCPFSATRDHVQSRDERGIGRWMVRKFS